MGVRRLWLLPVVVLIPAGTRAGDHKAEVFIAPYTSYSHIYGSGSPPASASKSGHSLSRIDVPSSNLGGWHVAGAVSLKKKQPLSFIGDLSVHSFRFPGLEAKRDVTQVVFMVGPRWTFFGGGKNMPFVHLMFLGAVHDSEGSVNADTTGAIAVGGGYDFVPKEKGPWGFRFQADYIMAGSGVDNSLRLSLGWVYRFHDPHP